MLPSRGMIEEIIKRTKMTQQHLLSAVCYAEPQPCFNKQLVGCKEPDLNYMVVLIETKGNTEYTKGNNIIGDKKQNISHNLSKINRGKTTVCHGLKFWVSTFLTNVDFVNDNFTQIPYC